MRALSGPTSQPAAPCSDTLATRAVALPSALGGAPRRPRAAGESGSGEICSLRLLHRLASAGICSLGVKEQVFIHRHPLLAQP